MVTIPRAVPVQHLNASRDKHRLSAVLARLWPESGAVSPLPALDGLRALAVLLVLLFHAWGEKNDWHNPLNYGRTGVHLFFVLSGFLLFVPYARYLFGLQQRPHTLRFYQRRILRVGPAYWISLGILSIVGVFPVFGLKDVLVHASYLFNAWPQSIYSINSVYWTMAIEVQFYAVLPLIGWITYALAHRAGPTLAAVIIVTGLFLISLGNNELKHLAHVSHLFVSPLLVGETSMPFWLGVFGAGIACAIVYVYLMEVAHLTVDAVKTLRTSSSVILAVGVAIGLVVAFTPRAATLPNKNVLFGLIYAALLVGILFGWPILRRPFTWGVMRFIGLISYSVYIWHPVAMRWIRPYLLGLRSMGPHVMGLRWMASHLGRLTGGEAVLVGFVLEALLCVPLAYLSFQLTERPFFQARKKAHDNLGAVPTHYASSEDICLATPPMALTESLG